MRFHRTILMNTPEDCEWLRTTHLKGKNHPEFKAFTLHGNEDSPAQLDLYATREPEYNENPVAIYSQDEDGELYWPSEPKPVIRRTRR